MHDTDHSPVEKPGILEKLDTQVDKQSAAQVPKVPSPLFSGDLQKGQGEFWTIEGEYPSSPEELAVIIKSLWDELKGIDDRTIHEIEFQATRRLMGFFGREDLEGALIFAERFLGDCITPDDVEANWDLVKIPSWLLESAYCLSSIGFDFEGLNLSQRPGRNRRLAHMAFEIQKQVPGSWFRMNQDTLADLLGCTQQNISKSLDLLVRIGWLKKQKVPTVLATGIGVQACEYQCIYAS